MKERRRGMSKAEDYITQNTQTLKEYGKEYFKWLTPDQARKAVEIAREEIYEWLQEHSQEYVYWMDEEFGKDNLINDLKQAMKDETQNL